jgi:tetratricopeptide (TPR) repeat protein
MAKRWFQLNRGVESWPQRGLLFTLTLTLSVGNLLPALAGTMPSNHPDSSLKANEAGIKFVQSEQYDKAARIFSRNLGTHNKAALALNYQILGATDLKVAKYSKGEAELNRALTMQEKLYGANDVHLVGVLNNLGQLYSQTGRYADAHRVLERAVRINQGRDEVQQADTLDNLANLYLLQGRSREAEAPAEKALTLRQQDLPMGDLKIAESLNTSALVALLQSKTADAQQHIRNALALTAENDSRMSSERARSLDLLAKVYVEGSTPNKARPLAIQALEIRQKIFGSKHPLVAETYLTLGSINMQLSAFKAAEDQFRSSLKIFQDFGDARAQDAVLATFAISFALAAQGKLIDSQNWWDQAMIMQNGLANGHLTCMDTLKATYANILWQHDNWSQALSIGGGLMFMVGSDGTNATTRSVVVGSTKKPTKNWLLEALSDPNAGVLRAALPLLCVIFLAILSTFANNWGLFSFGPILPRRNEHRASSSQAFWTGDGHSRQIAISQREPLSEHGLRQRFKRTYQ